MHLGKRTQFLYARRITNRSYVLSKLLTKSTIEQEA